MQISELSMNFGYNGKTIVTAWCKCHTADDVEEIIAWLKMAKDNMRAWEKIDAQARPKGAKDG
jgi:hypothetical protein